MFSENQLKEIEKIINLYNDKEYKEKRLQIYHKDTIDIDILEIYVIEEILLLGNKNIFNQIIKNNDIEMQKLCDNYNNFVCLYKNNKLFKKVALDKYTKNDSNLSNLYKKIINLIEENKITCLDRYDNYNEIRYSNDYEIRRTIFNLLIGDFFLNVISLSFSLTTPKEMQRKGLYNDKDKENIIKFMRLAFCNNLEATLNLVEDIFKIVKTKILFGLEKDAFGDLLEYNTNISMEEIFDIPKQKRKTL